MSQVYILRGLPGSGKSFWCKKFHPKAIVVSADQFFEGPDGYKHDASKLSEAHADCFRRFLNVTGISSNGTDVIVDNTGIEAFECAPYYLGARAYGWNVEIIEFRPHLGTDVMLWAEACYKRNTHGVPELVHRRMAERFFYGPALPPFWNVKIFRGD